MCRNLHTLQEEKAYLLNKIMVTIAQGNSFSAIFTWLRLLCTEQKDMPDLSLPFQH